MILHVIKSDECPRTLLLQFSFTIFFTIFLQWFPNVHTLSSNGKMYNYIHGNLRPCMNFFHAGSIDRQTDRQTGRQTLTTTIFPLPEITLLKFKHLFIGLLLPYTNFHGNYFFIVSCPSIAAFKDYSTKKAKWKFKDVFLALPGWLVG